MRPKRGLQAFECTSMIEPSQQRLSCSNFKRVFWIVNDDHRVYKMGEEVKMLVGYSM